MDRVFAAGAYHLIHGLGASLVVLRVKVPRSWLAMRSKPFWILAAAASLVLLVGVLALGGAFFDVDAARVPEIEAPWRRFTL